MSEPERRCWTCKNYSPCPTGFGECGATIGRQPSSIINVEWALMRPTDGADCPCWEAKE